MNAPGKVLRIDHIQLAMPKASEERARSFYRDVLGMKEIPKPEPLAKRGGCWFASGEAQVHLGIEEDFRPAKKAHPALVVEGLDEVLARRRRPAIKAGRRDRRAPTRPRVRSFWESPGADRSQRHLSRRADFSSF